MAFPFPKPSLDFFQAAPQALSFVTYSILLLFRQLSPHCRSPLLNCCGWNAFSSALSEQFCLLLISVSAHSSSGSTSLSLAFDYLSDFAVTYLCKLFPDTVQVKTALKDSVQEGWYICALRWVGQHFSTTESPNSGNSREGMVLNCCACFRRW